MAYFLNLFDWPEAEWAKMSRESLLDFLSHVLMWAAQIPIIYAWEKPICSLALSAVTLASMEYHASMGKNSTAARSYMFLDYVTVIVSATTAILLPLEALPSAEDWATVPGTLTIVFTVLITLMAIVNISWKERSRSRTLFHNIWHLIVPIPVVLYAYIKGDLRDTWKDTTVDHLQITAILVFVVHVLSNAFAHAHEMHVHQKKPSGLTQEKTLTPGQNLNVTSVANVGGLSF